MNFEKRKKLTAGGVLGSIAILLGIYCDGGAFVSDLVLNGPAWLRWILTNSDFWWTLVVGSVTALYLRHIWKQPEEPDFVSMMGEVSLRARKLATLLWLIMSFERAVFSYKKSPSLDYVVHKFEFVFCPEIKNFLGSESSDECIKHMRNTLKKSSNPYLVCESVGNFASSILLSAIEQEIEKRDSTEVRIIG